MKILHLGNVASVGYNLARGLRDKGHDVDLFDWGTTKIISREDAEWIIHPKRNLLDASDFLALKIGKYDIIHLHTLLSDYCVLQSIKHILRAGTPIKFVHAHSSVFSGTKEMSPRIKSAIIRFGAKTVFYSTPNIHENIDWFPQKKAFLPNPVDTKRFKPIGEIEYSNRVLCWVKLDPTKGYEKIFKTMKLCPDIGFDVPKIGMLYQDDEIHLPDNARFISPVSHADVPELLNKYPVILEQFNYGAFGMSGLEAMACGKPVISYWKEGNDKLYPEPCPVVNAREPNEIAEKIKETLANHELIGKKSREWVMKNHSIDVVVDKLLAEYERA